MKVTTAVIGAGVVSKTHLSADTANPRTDLVAVCDLDEDRARSLAAEYGITPYFDADDLLAREELDLVHICTPVQTHVALARAAIEQGVAVVVEKPLAETTEEIETVMSLSEQHDVPVTVIHQHKYDPAIRTARRRIADGEIGEVRSVELVKTGLTLPDESNRGSWVDGLPGGEFEEGLPHHIYPLFSVGGHPASEDDLRVSTSLVGDYDADYTYDNAQLQYVTDSGTLCTSTIVSGGHAERMLHVQGTKGAISADLITQVVTRSRGSYRGSAVRKVKKSVDVCVDQVVGTLGNVRMVLENTFDDSWETEKQLNQHYYQLDRVVTALETGREMPVPLEDAWWTAAITERIREDGTERTTEAAAVSP